MLIIFFLFDGELHSIERQGSHITASTNNQLNHYLPKIGVITPFWLKNTDSPCQKEHYYIVLKKSWNAPWACRGVN